MVKRRSIPRYHIFSNHFYSFPYSAILLLHNYLRGWPFFSCTLLSFLTVCTFTVQTVRKMILEIFLSVYCDFRICCFNCIVEVRDCLILCLLTSFNRRDCISPSIADTFVVSCYFRSINVLCLI